jgi:L-seryl-tRNA(Ser) seleniumtransferase
MKKKKTQKSQKEDPRRSLPSMSVLLEQPRIQNLIESYSRPMVSDAIRDALAGTAQGLKRGGPPPETSDIVLKVESMVAKGQMDRLRQVVNGAGIILHTNLGRAVLPSEAAKALSRMEHCCNIQVDMETGERGKRNYMTEQLLTRLTGAEAAMVVNNNAAATYLILTVLCQGREVIVSRGQLIEIGGSFRLPDCMRQSGSIMKEVGTTNKTHLRDYENALTEETAAIIRVYPSNYRVIGFTKQVSIEELATLKKKHHFVLIDDLGCGALVDLSKLGLPLEPTVPGTLAAGADLVCCSGDKLIGGPQAGIIVGRKDLVAKIKKHPLTRMLRVCKLTDIALENTLRLFLDPETLLQKHPTLRMMTLPLASLKKRAQKIKTALDKEKLSLEIRVGEEETAVGGGTLPDYPLQTYVINLRSSRLSPPKLSFLLRQHEPAIISRISKQEVVLDMRTVLESEDKIVLDALKRIGSA